MSRSEAWRELRSRFAETMGPMALISALGGVLLAFVVDRVGPDPDLASFAITVDQARSTLLSTLALIFTGLSIVLTLSALVAQNTSSRFSPRLFRLQLRFGLDKVMIAAFALTASYIVTIQVLLRTRRGDEPAQPLGLVVAVVLVVLAGAMTIWYINSTLQSIRVDRTIRWVAHRVMRASEGRRRGHGDVAFDWADVQRPPDALGVVAQDDGYVVGHDVNRLEQLASDHGASVAIDAVLGRPVVRGEEIGWVSAASPLGAEHLVAMAECVIVAPLADARSDPGYGIGVLLDIAVISLSPAVNDPRTAVQSTEQLTQVLMTLADHRIGTWARVGPHGTPTVVVRAETVGERLDSAGRAILRYGSEDPMVTAAVLRLAHQVERVAPSDRDRELARSLVHDVEAEDAKR